MSGPALVASDRSGEPLDQHFVDAVELHFSSFAIKRSAPVGAPTFRNLTITEHVDRSSPALMLAAASGAPIPSPRLGVRRPGGTAEGRRYLEYCLQNVVVMSDALESANADDRPGRASSRRTATRRTQPKLCAGAIAPPSTIPAGVIVNSRISGW